MILPGATLGMLGGGQLGRMFTVAARTMGYKVIVLEPDPRSPAGAMADVHLCAAYDDEAALQQMAAQCAVVTTEFENIPTASLTRLAASCPVRPGAAAVGIVQDRIREKSFLREHGFATAPFAVITEQDDLHNAIANIRTPAILKVSRFGYDGKGQARVNSMEEAVAAFEQMGSQPCVLEQQLNLDKEVSVVIARGLDGSVKAFPVAENRHENGILDVSIVPARIAPAVAEHVVAVATAIAKHLDYFGVVAVEFFIVAGQLLVNEIAPRPHNSGHYSLDACITDQFEQQVRAVCGLSLGETDLLSPVVMVNLLGDLWATDRDIPHWDKLLAHPGVKLHLYGKHEARPGRKMGHYNCLSASLDEAIATGLDIKKALCRELK
jgi:5-(carboxyamino)imidazole ribonucleotide synthase